MSQDREPKLAVLKIYRSTLVSKNSKRVRVSRLHSRARDLLSEVLEFDSDGPVIDGTSLPVGALVLTFPWITKIFSGYSGLEISEFALTKQILFFYNGAFFITHRMSLDFL